MDIYFTFENGTCNQFHKEGGEKETVTIVISPLRIEGTGTERLKLISGCNMWQGCRNLDCFFSSASREKSNKARQKQKS